MPFSNRLSVHFRRVAARTLRPINCLILLLGAAAALGCQEPPTAVPSHQTASHEDHSGPGSSGPDLHSRNMKLLANVPRTGDATQTDLAFAGRYAYAGSYKGFRVIDLSDPERPTVVSEVPCNGAQADLSVYRTLLFFSVDQAQSSPACDSEDVFPDNTTFEGVRIFDVSDPAAPRHIASVPTDCGSHTHTLVPDPARGRVLLYISSYPGGLFTTSDTCDAPHGYISIVSVPLANPAAATVTKHQLDAGTQSWSSPARTSCHDITVFLELRRAAAACMSETQLWDISDPAQPSLLWRFDHPAVNTANHDIWHSAAFSWDGEIVAFGDESGGGAESRCEDPSDEHGRIWFVAVATGAVLGSYKIPRAEPGPCTSHNFNFIPLSGGRKVLVAASYTGGTTIVDVDSLLAGASAAAAEVGFYRPSGSRAWSSYWYNGLVVVNDMLRGLDVMLLSDAARSGARKLPYLNPQTQEKLIP
jgi:hypothetical protein